MQIKAKIINTRVSSWVDKKTKTIKYYLIVSVKSIDGSRYAINVYGRNMALLNQKKGAMIICDIGKIRKYKSHHQSILNTLKSMKYKGVMSFKEGYRQDDSVYIQDIKKNKKSKQVSKFAQTNKSKQDSPRVIIGMGLLGLLF